MAQSASSSPPTPRSARTTSTKPATKSRSSKYLPKLASGEWIGCWSLTEPEAGSDAAGTRTTAVRDGDCWVINGSKTFTTNAHYADVCVGMAMTDRSRRAARHFRFHSRKGHAGFSRRQKGKQARPARQRHRRSDLHQLPRAADRSCSANRAKASSTACASSMAAASPSPRSPSGWRRAPTTPR